MIWFDDKYIMLATQWMIPRQLLLRMECSHIDEKYQN